MQNKILFHLLSVTLLLSSISTSEAISLNPRTAWNKLSTKTKWLVGGGAAVVAVACFGKYGVPAAKNHLAQRQRAHDDAFEQRVANAMARRDETQGNLNEQVLKAFFGPSLLARLRDNTTRAGAVQVVNQYFAKDGMLNGQGLLDVAWNADQRTSDQAQDGLVERARKGMATVDYVDHLRSEVSGALNARATNVAVAGLTTRVAAVEKLAAGATEQQVQAAINQHHLVNQASLDAGLARTLTASVQEARKGLATEGAVSALGDRATAAEAFIKSQTLGLNERITRAKLNEALAPVITKAQLDAALTPVATNATAALETAVAAYGYTIGYNGGVNGLAKAPAKTVPTVTTRLAGHDAAIAALQQGMKQAAAVVPLAAPAPAANGGPHTPPADQAAQAKPVAAATV